MKTDSKGIRLCEEKGCKEKHYARGFCKNHYQQHRYRTEPRLREGLLKRNKANWKKYYKKMMKADRDWNNKRQKAWRKKSQT